MPKFIEMDQTVTLADQLKDEGGAVVLINTFVARPADADRLLSAWTADAEVMKRQPGSYRPSCTAASPAAACS
ncbi:hypothetical protein BGCPKDLD_0755 [Methylorubrum suomiense]|uniref:Uncharacterized protein n=1 Tax=Methylorubrum suomiense TaxID=144191 RepID=A0ABQ4UPJ3_9HYPH|nr:hypothetical protein BGCPKDLD_0755 [Methylorubrum suomiense]